MYSARGNAALPALGFPIRASADHGLFSASPRLIAAVHALHRLLVPRHPPCALPILTVIRPRRRPQAEPVGPVIPVRARSRADADVGIAVRFSRSVERRRPDWPPVSQNSTACSPPPRGRWPGSVDVLGADTVSSAAVCGHWTRRPLQSWSSLERR